MDKKSKTIKRMETADARKRRLALNTIIALKRNEGLYQFEIAERLGISAGLFSQWLKGWKPIPEKWWKRILAELGVKRPKRKAA